MRQGFNIYLFFVKIYRVYVLSLIKVLNKIVFLIFFNDSAFRVKSITFFPGREIYSGYRIYSGYS